ncbi:MAG: glycoside hydrolase family 15 protein, partial [Sporichthyaceae bacterium]|nr:glycoside hydrolase family 15 protein [Sporichthyaceae bacterium]
YGIEGERQLVEHELEHLDGFAGSRPVRVGNAAWQQRQHDVLGEVLDAAFLLKDTISDLGPQTRALLVGLANKAVDSWPEPDAGMWEARDTERHYLSSKVMCWVATDRAIALADALEATDDDVERWTEAREEIRAAVLDRGWNDEVGAYTGSFDSAELDASVLVLPLVGFLPATDERMRRTMDVIEERLGNDGLIKRWDEDAGAFVLCSFWLVECLVMAGEIDRARTIFDHVVPYANDLGLFAEQLDLQTGVQLGNTPQALSHIGVINAAWRLDEYGKDLPTTPRTDHD